MTDTGQFVRVTLRISGGVIIWALHFAVIYGYTGLACARRFAPNAEAWLGAVPWVLAGATAAGVVAALVLVVTGFRSRERERFTPWMSAWIAVLAAGAMVLEALGVLWLPVCG